MKVNDETAGLDACDLLERDHKKVEELFAQYHAAGNDKAKKSQLAQTICQELSTHTLIEDEIFYPAFRKATGDDDLVDEAEEEHEEARNLIAEIEDAEDMDPLIAKLQAAINHHVSEERTEMFPKARKSPGLDLLALGRKLQDRKAELMGSQERA